MWSKAAMPSLVAARSCGGEVARQVATQEWSCLRRNSKSFGRRRLVDLESLSPIRKYTPAASSPASASGLAGLPHFTLYTGTGCSLCDVVKDQLKRLSAQHPHVLRLYNIRDDGSVNVKYWRRLYQYDIPVLHLEGQEVARHSVSDEKLLEILTQAKAGRYSETQETFREERLRNSRDHSF
ncbi:Thioredoxin-like fold [Ceraceosorus bombacis]|uniref:Glutaredoxin-like protein n=1 Tax=Ceraceosorus bombacis TaxID=401625 RepID=A0A0P1BNK6_9BASI|nr:Thioredoxin-like fold [Ceraceosorus bombacis]